MINTMYSPSRRKGRSNIHHMQVNAQLLMGMEIGVIGAKFIEPYIEKAKADGFEIEYEEMRTKDQDGIYHSHGFKIWKK